jgi:hypothetical protein
MRLQTFAKLLCCAALAAFAAQARAEVARPFNGKSLEGWTLKGPETKSHWMVGVAKVNPNHPELLIVKPVEKNGQLVNAKAHGVDIYSNAKYGDCTLEIEVLVPKGSNSGIYMMGEYEVQVLDSYGKEKVGPGDIGGLYNAAAPRVNAAKPPGEWQKFVIEFQAPKFKNGEKVSHAVFKKVTLNGQVIHENVELKGPTPGGVTGKEAAQGPLMFQGNHGAVAYRNIKVILP